MPPQITAPDACGLLLAVSPTFLGVAYRELDQIDFLDSSTVKDQVMTDTSNFLGGFITALYFLQVLLLEHWDYIQDSVQGSRMEGFKVQQNLLRILDKLENSILSRNKIRAVLASMRINFQDEAGTTYPKLRALRKALPNDHPQRIEETSDFADDIIRIYRKDPKQRHRMVDHLKVAHEFFNDLVAHSSGSYSPRPTRFSLYPLKHVRGLTKTLFNTIEENWCRCKPPSRKHAGRKTRLHLTEHQCFDTAPSSRSHSWESKAKFRLLFSTSTSGPNWQSTEITVTDRDYGKELAKVPHKLLEKGLCEVIHGVKDDLRPRIAIYGHKLWKLVSQSVYDNKQSHSPAQLLDRDFVSLRDWLCETQFARGSTLSWVDARDRLILSFVLTTSVLHFLNGPWLQPSFCSENICFLVSKSSQPDITKPYLSTECSARLEGESSTIDLEQPHPVPHILSLGILLLEIASGKIVDISEDKDRCSEAIRVVDEWKRSRADLCIPIYGYLYQAISACVLPGKLEKHRLHEIKDNERRARGYIFDEVLWPLESALFEEYKIKPSTLNTEITPINNFIGVDPFEQEYEDSIAMRPATQKWFESLDILKLSLQDNQRKCKRVKEEIVSIKVAVLDTGFEIPSKLLQEHYCQERISKVQSEDFTHPRENDARRGWDIDDDGHGSRVGEIVLQVAPEAVLHVAKVLNHRNDIGNPDMSEQVHKQISKAIERASNVWRVDIIVMSFGFDKRIDSISHVMENIEDPPLFFAATRNDGANKAMAWPAKDRQVIGVSSTDGYGVRSRYNPKVTDGNYPVLYAFGEGFPVTVKSGNKRHVEGTSYATPVAAALVANFLSRVRMIVATLGDRPECCVDIPKRLRNVTAMAAVLKECMEKENDKGDKVFLPWEFLKVNDRRIMEDIYKALESV